jgi:hypothetical protein
MLVKPLSRLPESVVSREAKRGERGAFVGDYGDIKKKIDACYLANQTLWMSHQIEATIDSRLEAGEVANNLDTNSSPQFYNGSRDPVNCNRVRPMCAMVSGKQRQQRKSLIVAPLENGDQLTADQMTKVLMHIHKNNQFDDIFSEAFHQGACITGMNLIQAYLDFTDDPIFGDIKYKNLTYNQFFIDPYFRDKSLSDCNFVWIRSYLTHSAAAALMPQFADEIMGLPGNPTGAGRDGRFMYMPQSYGVAGQNLLAYDEYYYRDFRTREILIDKESGMWREITKEQMETHDFDFMMANYPQLEVQTQTIPTVRLAILIQDRVFYDGQNPFGIDCFNFVPVIGYYNPMMPYYYSRIQGICRSLRSPQAMLNRRIMLSSDLLESVANSGYIFKVGSVVDIKHLFQTGQGRIIPLKDEAQMSDIVPIQPPHIDTSMFTQMDVFSNEMHKVSGITEENMGYTVDENASGFKTAIRQIAGSIALQPLFDNADFSLKAIGELSVKMFTANYGPMKIRMILEGQEPTPQFHNKAFGKYHCMVQEGYGTDSQKQLQFAQLFELKQAGIDIPNKALIEAASIQNKTELIQMMEQREQMQMQMQQMQMQMQMQQGQAQVELTKARSVADQGLGLERISRVEENKALAVERRAQAQRDEASAEREHEQALLNFVRATKELQGLDIEQLHRMAEISKMLKELDQPVENNGSLSSRLSVQ